MYELVIFDFDDTLLHLDIRWGNVKKEMIALVEAEGLQLDTSQHLILLSNAIGESGAKRKKAVDEIYRKYEGECARKGNYSFFPGMVELVKELKSGGKRLALASGNHTSNIKEILGAAGLLDCFDVVCGRDIVEKNKPAPDQLFRIMEELKASREKTMFIGNSRFDELAAAAAGVPFIRFQPRKGDSVEALRKKLL